MFIGLKDDGLYRGDGAFEVIRLYDGRPFALDDHVARLERSAASLRLDGYTYTVEGLRTAFSHVGPQGALAVSFVAGREWMVHKLIQMVHQATGREPLVYGRDGKVTLLTAVTKDLLDRVNANALINKLAPIVGGKGGGKPDLAQAGGKDPDKLNEAIEHAPQALREVVGG